MVQEAIQVQNAKFLLIGFAFKENCPDIRNTKIIDVVNELKEYNAEVDIYDPWCSADALKTDFNLELAEPVIGKYDAIIIAVAHEQFKAMSIEQVREFGKPNCVIYDLKYVFQKQDVDIRL